MLLTCCISAGCSAYMELLIKDPQRQNVHVQNVLLYLWGFLLNATQLAVTSTQPISLETFFKGWNVFTTMLLVGFSFYGIGLSALLKYGDNMHKVYGQALAMVLCAVVSNLLEFKLPSLLVVATLLVISAILLFYIPIPRRGTVLGSKIKPTVVLARRIRTDRVENDLKATQG